MTPAAKSAGDNRPHFPVPTPPRNESKSPSNPKTSAVQPPNGAHRQKPPSVSRSTVAQQVPQSSGGSRQGVFEKFQRSGTAAESKEPGDHRRSSSGSTSRSKSQSGHSGERPDHPRRESHHPTTSHSGSSRHRTSSSGATTDHKHDKNAGHRGGETRQRQSHNKSDKHEHSVGQRDQEKAERDHKGSAQTASKRPDSLSLDTPSKSTMQNKVFTTPTTPTKSSSRNSGTPVKTGQTPIKVEPSSKQSTAPKSNPSSSAGHSRDNTSKVSPEKVVTARSPVNASRHKSPVKAAGHSSHSSQSQPKTWNDHLPNGVVNGMIPVPKPLRIQIPPVVS